MPLTYTNGSDQVQVLVIGKEARTLQAGASAYLGPRRGLDGNISDPGVQPGETVQLQLGPNEKPIKGRTVERAGRVRGLTAFLTEARSAGSLTFKVTKNGSAQTALNAAIDSGAVQYDEVFGDAGDLTYAAGDRLGLQVVSSGFTPTTSDAVGILELDEGL